MTSVYSRGSGTLASKTRYTRRFKLEKPKNREAEKLKTENEEVKRRGRKS